MDQRPTLYRTFRHLDRPSSTARSSTSAHHSTEPSVTLTDRQPQSVIHHRPVLYRTFRHLDGPLSTPRSSTSAQHSTEPSVTLTDRHPQPGHSPPPITLPNLPSP
ncbi:hypothetical protein BV898_05889 [Hypsibius exemplaris]|uniref:Uncharacterized protein n=1 Tax=Hypsibius exemplaris TaxID=2072580 RepID=A0A1W0WY21_HYPEX|nr:hypothetical protein BV898_05889 [Hypsibius exemplaris]